MLEILKEQDDKYSCRRVVSMMSLAIGGGLGFYALKLGAKGWESFSPSICFLGASVVILFFTTWGDIAQVARGIKGNK